MTEWPDRKPGTVLLVRETIAGTSTARLIAADPVALITDELMDAWQAGRMAPYVDVQGWETRKRLQDVTVRISDDHGASYVWCLTHWDAQRNIYRMEWPD